MRKFKSKKKAIEYAEEEIGKNDWEVVEVNGTRTILCSTGLAVNTLIREQIEELFYGIVKLAEKHIDSDTEDGILFLGAQTTEFIMKNSKKLLGVDILCAWQEY